MGSSFDKFCYCYNYKKNNLYNFNIGWKNNKINNKNIDNSKRKVFNINAGSEGNEINNDFLIKNNEKNNGVNKLLNCVCCSCGNEIINNNIHSKHINDLMCCSCGNKIYNIDNFKNDINKKNNLYNNINSNESHEESDDILKESSIPMHVTYKNKKK